MIWLYVGASVHWVSAVAEHAACLYVVPVQLLQSPQSLFELRVHSAFMYCDVGLQVRQSDSVWSFVPSPASDTYVLP